MASSLIATTSLGAMIDTDLTDIEVEYLIDGAEDAIEQIVGDVDDGARVHRTRIWPPTPYLWLPHQAESVQSVVMDDDTVSSDDYEIEEDGSLLRRKQDSAGAYQFGYRSWGGEVLVNYTRELHTAFWREALIDLVRVSAGRMGIANERTGPYAVAAADSEMLRQEILTRVRVREPGGVLAV